jgi:hypothetical protein
VKRLVSTIPVAVAVVGLSGCVVAGTSRSGNGGASLFFLFIPAFVIGLMLMVGRAGRRSQGRWSNDGRRWSSSPDVNDADDRMLKAELSVLADDVLRLEPQVTLKPEARDDFEAALHRYRVAQAALETSDAPVDLHRLRRVVDEATWLMSRVRARLDDRPPPGPPASLRTPGSRGEPAIELDDRAHPTYAGSRAPFTSGWFSVGSGIFGGLLLGSVMDEMSWDDSESGDEPYDDSSGPF